MKYHCGLLDEQPHKNPAYEYVTRAIWDHIPPDIHHELMVWLAMPGFSLAFHEHVFGLSGRYILERMPSYDDYRTEVGENWLSTTREDCIKLANMRKGMGDIPTIAQLQILEDLKSYPYREVAQTYNLTEGSIHRWRARGVTGRNLPQGFELLRAPKSFVL